MPNLDRESYRDVTLSFCVLFFVSFRLVLSCFVLCVVLCCVVLCLLLFFVFSFLCFLLFAPFLCFLCFFLLFAFCCIFYSLLSPFLRSPVFSFFSLVVVLCCLLALPVSACLIFLSLCLYSFSVPVPVSAGYGLVTCF